MTSFSNQLLHKIASFSDIEERISINRLIDEPAYRYSQKFKVSSECMAEERFMNEFSDTLERYGEIGGVNDESVKVLIRMLKTALSDAGLKFMKKHGKFTKNVNDKAFDIVYRYKSYQWFNSPSKPNRLILKAYARQCFKISGNIVSMHLRNGTIALY